MKGYNKPIFGGVPKKNIQRSRFDLSHEWKSNFNPGRLIPCLLLETMPNDEFSIDSEFMFRFSPLYFPIMHKLTMRADYFYVPNRVLWPYQSVENKGWVHWITNEEEYVHPYTTTDLRWEDSTLIESVGYYFGLPVLPVLNANYESKINNLNAFPFSAYLKIWDIYYRVPQLEDERWFPLNVGNNTTAFSTAYNASVARPDLHRVFSSKWQKDYFTSALPQPQLGDAVTIPTLDENLPITQTARISATGAAVTGPLSIIAAADGGVQDSSATDIYIDQDNPATIRQLRIAEVLQSYYERLIKIGSSMYRDFIKGMYGNDPEPNTIDQPVQFGSKFGRVQISDVMTQASYDYAETGTSRTGDYTGQASMYSNDGGRLRYDCNEHGWIMCILQVNPNTSYGQGVERFWRREVQTDYPLDMFSSIGDQEILKEEVLYNAKTTNLALNQDTFGYIPRFSEMRFKNDIYTAGLQKNNGLSQHLGRFFTTDIYETAEYNAFVTINDEFTDVQPDGNTLVSADEIGGIRISDVFRILPNAAGTQVESEAVIYAHVYHDISVNRQLPMFSVPDLT